MKAMQIDNIWHFCEPFKQKSLIAVQFPTLNKSPKLNLVRSRHTESLEISPEVGIHMDVRNRCRHILYIRTVKA